jgi:polyhydroxybutyrate depolymerase
MSLIVCRPERKNKPLQCRIFVILTLGLLMGATACSPAGAKPTPTLAPTATAPATATPAPTLQPGDSTRTLTVGGSERTYLLHIPPGLDMGHPAPVVFVFHGFDPEAHFAVSDIQNISGFNDIADKNGFLVVYPTGISGTWNAGTCCGIAVQNNVDDAAFVRQMLSDLGRIARLDPKRIYATGFTFGAMLSYRLACEMSDTFAAIAPLAGVLVYSPCQPQEPVSVLHIHGLKDIAVPFAGGPGILASGKFVFPFVEEGIATWVKLDGCSSTPQVEKKDLVTHTVYPACQSGTAVELYTHDALGDSWPSPYVFPAAQIIWDFFAAHPKH